jgi:hypothetical protein
MENQEQQNLALITEMTDRTPPVQRTRYCLSPLRLVSIHCQPGSVSAHQVRFSLPQYGVAAYAARCISPGLYHEA